MITILEILKRNLTELDYKMEICWENIKVNEKMEKNSCIKVIIKINENFIRINTEILKSTYFINFSITRKK